MRSFHPTESFSGFFPLEAAPFLTGGAVLERVGASGGGSGSDLAGMCGHDVMTLLTLSCPLFADSWESQTLVGREGALKPLTVPTMGVTYSDLCLTGQWKRQ